jgi:probable rRNA maturation factor
MEINVLFDERFEGYLEVGWLESVAEHVLIAENVDPRTELSLVIVGQERIRQLNLSYLGKDEPTDVMAFPMLPDESGKDIATFVMPPDEIKHLGEVIISYPQAVIQAEEHQHPIKEEITILAIHGVLHLLGYDHDQPESEKNNV